MINKRGGGTEVLKTVIVLIGVIAILHTLGHIYIYKASNISGLAFADTQKLDAIKQSHPLSQAFSLIIIIGEWVMFASFVVGARSHRAKISLKEIRRLMGEHKEKNTLSRTDLDILYDILKEKKSLGLSETASAFEVDKELAASWFKMLEESNLATIEYSGISTTTLRIKE